jgi:hypothetical protein
MSVELTNYDIAILSCLRTWGQRERVEELRGLVSFMDFYDHSILTFEEFSRSLHKLIQRGIVDPNEKELKAEAQYLHWYSKTYAKKKVGLQKELKDTKAFVEKTYALVLEPGSQHNLTILRDEFEAAVKAYVSK